MTKMPRVLKYASAALAILLLFFAALVLFALTPWGMTAAVSLAEKMVPQLTVASTEGTLLDASLEGVSYRTPSATFTSRRIAFSLANLRPLERHFDLKSLTVDNLTINLAGSSADGSDDPAPALIALPVSVDIADAKFSNTVFETDSARIAAERIAFSGHAAADKAVCVVLKNLRGGHSGLEINEGRANANKLMARVVRDAVSEFDACLAEWKGGNMRNAIPRECEVVLTLPAENVEAFKEAVADWKDTFVEEYGTIETELAMTVEEVALPQEIVPQEIQDNLVDALCACHNGVLRFIPANPSIVETSSNLAIVEIGGGKASVLILVRSSCDSMRECCVETLESAFAMAGMKIELDGEYPAWQPNWDSEIVALMKKIYHELYNEENRVQVVHAGLECGIIGTMYPQMDLVSFGPTLRSPHTPGERCHIPSVEKYWRFVLKTLENIPEK